MKAKIVSISQTKNSNVLEIEYESGARRFCELDGWGHYHMTKTQRDFIGSARQIKTKNATYWKM